MRDRITEQLREVACLAHTIPGTTLRLHAHHGRSLLVSRHCLGADLDPCRFRAIVAARAATHLATTITHIEYVAGLVHLGAGLHTRHDDSGRQEYWFVTTLPHEHVAGSLEALDTPPHTEQLDVTIRPDLDLGMCAVRVTSTDPRPRLDDIALSILSRCMVAELLASLEPATSHRPPRTPPKLTDR